MPSETYSRTPERSLLLECVRGWFGETKTPISSESVGTDFDWDWFAKLAGEHRLSPLVYWRLTESGISVPESTMADLESHTEWVTFRNLNMVGTLHEAFELFEENGIRALPYKGPALAATVHQDLAFRASADLDVLLPKDQMIEARNLLLDHGFRPKREMSEQELQTSLRSSRHISVIDDDDIRIELHWRVTGGRFPFPVDFDELWAHRENVEVSGQTLPMLAPEDLVTLLAVHGNRHCWTQLAWLCDFAGVVETYEFDWGQVLREARVRGAERIVLIGLQLAADIVDIEIPTRAQQRIGEDWMVLRLAKRVEEEFLWVQPQPLSSVRYRLQARERMGDRIRMTGRLAFLPSKMDFDFLPAWAQFYPLAVLCRPIRVGFRTGRLLHSSLSRGSGNFEPD